MTVANTAVVALALILSAHAEQRFADFKPLPANQYPSYQELQGLGLAVVPMPDKASQMSYLGADLLAQGFLPVYIAIENRANPHSAMLVREAVLYGHGDSETMSQNPRALRPGPTKGMDRAETAARLWGGVPGAVGVVLVLHKLSNITNIRLNLLEKELRSQTVAPGKTGGGFVFAPVMEGRTRAKDVLLDVPLKDGDSNEDVHFHFRIDTGAEAK
jgi:hypothetical protein